MAAYFRYVLPAKVLGRVIARGILWLLIGAAVIVGSHHLVFEMTAPF